MTNPNDFSYKYSTGAKLVVTFVSILVLFGLIGSFISLKPKLWNLLNLLKEDR